ncbi:LysR family transcriptional regulator [Paracoccus onubensis]|uniref:LysR family transcriptional regulator n=1 Tax=Paracoccus onubensis TaxID=1675788 RepID=A0A418SUD7_9RHOB|nr:LysR family transcriptional regulator [Paracoccus onubensis]RJE84555.1 LysR family transcriptional regulator [Paracoccus onubensis]
MINTDLFKDFLHLVQSRNFSTTARDRSMSQSTLSRRIATLEAFVGSALFDRAIQPVSLTEAGEALLPLAQDILEKMDTVHGIGHPNARRPDQKCHLIALSTLALHFFPGWLAQYETDRVWQVDLLNTEPLLAANIRNFLRGQAEFLLTFAHDRVPDLQALRHHRYIVLGHETAVPVTRSDGYGGPLWSFESKDEIAYCGYTKGSFFQQALSPFFDRLGPRLRKVRDNSMAAVIHGLVRQGHGMCWLPRMMIGDDLKSGILVRAGGTEFDLETEIRLYRSHNMDRYAQSVWNAVSEGHQICRKAVRIA